MRENVNSMKMDDEVRGTVEKECGGGAGDGGECCRGQKRRR